MSIIDRYLDWEPILNSIENIEDLTVLELGCGLGTSQLLNKFKFVYSFETNSRDIDGKWFDYVSEQHVNNSNWKGYYNTNFPGININVNKFKNEVLDTIDISAIDVLFVDTGFAQRAQCVLEFANLLHFKYIFVHDTMTEPLLYEWKLLENMPSNYSLHAEIVSGQGTKLWKLN